MKLNTANEGLVDVTLSKRNLLALLHKLEDSTSQRAIQRFDMSHQRWVIVRAEPDELHYQGREPGRMAPETERFIKNQEAGEGASSVLDDSAPSWLKDKEVQIA